MSSTAAPSNLAGFAALALLALLCALALDLRDPAAFEWLFGPLPPLAVLAGSAGLGLGALWLIERRGLGRPGARVSWRALLGLGVLFGLPPIAIDLALPFPRDLNVALPDALLFYPAAGFAAEALFHLVPLAATVALFPRHAGSAWILLPAILAEPLFQAAASGGLTAQGGLVAVHVAAFSTVQLLVFRRHGILAMFALRLAFYLVWHLIWGTLRLWLLF